jgi:hypothetical protein
MSHVFCLNRDDSSPHCSPLPPTQSRAYAALLLLSRDKPDTVYYLDGSNLCYGLDPALKVICRDQTWGWRRPRTFPSKRSRIISRQLSSALLTLPLSLPPVFTLAALSVQARLCARQLLRTKTNLRPCLLGSNSLTTYHKSTASFSSVATGQRTTSKLRPRLALARSSAFRLQKRFCQSEVTSSFVVMASDRDILPAWSVLYQSTSPLYMLG